MTNEAEKIRRYYLGTLAEADAEEIELRLISDAEFEEKVIAVENDLVEDRLDGTLSGDEMTAFDQNYLSTPQRIKNFEAVGLLRRYAKGKAAIASTAENSESSENSLFDALRSLFSRMPGTVFAACLILAIGIGGIFIWLSRNSNNGGVQAEYAALNKEDLSDLDRFKSLPLITAVPGSLRGASSGPKITAVEGTVFVRLALVEFKEQAAFNVSLIRGENVLLGLEAVKAYDAGGGREIRLLLPAKLLEKGTYQISASPVDHPDSPVRYSFTIE